MSILSNKKRALKYITSMHKGKPGFKRSTQLEVQEARVIMKFFNYPKDSIRIVQHSWWMTHIFQRFMRGACEVDELVNAIDEFLYHKERSIKLNMRKRDKFNY